MFFKETGVFILIKHYIILSKKHPLPVAAKDLDSETNKFQIQHKLSSKKSTVALIQSKIGTFLAIKKLGTVFLFFANLMVSYHLKY